MERYNFAECEGASPYKIPTGKWVKYDEAMKEITQLRAENDVLREAHGEQERYLHEAEKLRAELAAYESALEEIATYDTGATAGLAYTARQALTTRRNK